MCLTSAGKVTCISYKSRGSTKIFQILRLLIKIFFKLVHGRTMKTVIIALLGIAVLAALVSSRPNVGGKTARRAFARDIISELVQGNYRLVNLLYCVKQCHVLALKEDEHAWPQIILCREVILSSEISL
jgi:hypothetical protein